MALTVTVNKRTVYGDQRVIYATVAFDNSYPTGGEAVDVSMFGGQLTELTDAILLNSHNLAASRIVVWDRPNKKLKLFTALSTEAANASDQSTINDIRVVFVGK